MSAEDVPQWDEIVLTEEIEPRIVVVTLNRPARLNALSQGLIAELHRTPAWQPL